MILIADGHRDEDLWSYSFDKLSYFAALTQERRAREAALADLRQLQIISAAIGRCMSQENEPGYTALVNRLEEAAGLKEAEQKNPKDAVRRLARRIKNIGKPKPNKPK